MNTKKTLLAIIIQFSLQAVAMAGDVEIHLPAASDAMTVDQPAGTELMRVNGNGNVGIGTSAPAGILDVAGGMYSYGQVVISQDTGNTVTYICSKDGTTTKGAGINLYNEDSSSNTNQMILHADQTYVSDAMSIATPTVSDGTANGGQLLKLDVGGAVGASHYCDVNGENCQTAAGLAADNLGDHTATQDIDLATHNLVGNGGSVGIAIDATGKVGMGTATPASSLDILGSSASIITLRDGDSTVNDPGHAAAVHLLDGQGATTGFMGFGTGAEGMSIQNANDDGGIHFSTGGNTNQMTVAANGKVGIGTQTPTATFFSVDLDTSDAGYPAVSGDHVATADGRVASFATGARTLDLGINSTDGTAWLQPRNLAGYSQNNNLILNPNGGAVGVGTTAPSTALDVNGVITSSGGNASMTINNTGPLPNGMTHNFQSNGTDIARITGYTGDDVTGNLYFGVLNGGSVQDSLSILSSGNVGVGTTTPAESLHVGAGNLLVQNSRPLLRLSDDAGAANDKNFQVQNVDGALYFGSADDNWAWDHPGDYTMVLQNNGDALFNTGNVGIGTTTPTQKLDVAGRGVVTENLAIRRFDNIEGGQLSLYTATGDGEWTVDDIDMTSLSQNRRFRIFPTLSGVAHEDRGIHVDTDTGNVGIGAPIPAVKLHVAGPDTWIDSAGGYAETRYTSATSLGDWSVGTGGSANDGFYIFDYNGPAADRNRLYIDNAGNMRVGGLLGGPIASKLDVLGNIKVADEGFPCDPTREGQIRYEAALKKHQGCDGTSWNNLY